MLYELIGVVRPGRGINEIKEIAKTTGNIVLSRRGVIRGITNWGPFLLPKPTTKHQSQHHTGHYFVMRFDSSAPTQATIRRSLGLDPRMIRFSVVKLGDRLGGREGRTRQGAIEHLEGATYREWAGREHDAQMMNMMEKQFQRGAKLPDNS